MPLPAIDLRLRQSEGNAPHLIVSENARLPWFTLDVPETVEGIGIDACVGKEATGLEPRCLDSEDLHELHSTQARNLNAAAADTASRLAAGGTTGVGGHGNFVATTRSTWTPKSGNVPPLQRHRSCKQGRRTSAFASAKLVASKLEHSVTDGE